MYLAVNDSTHAYCAGAGMGGAFPRGGTPRPSSDTHRRPVNDSVLSARGSDTIATRHYDAMASPHASSFICLPFSDHSDMVTAYTVYFGVCIGSALIGVFGAAIFLTQVIRTASDGYTGKATSQRWILIMLAVSDLFADLGKSYHNLKLDIIHSSLACSS